MLKIKKGDTVIVKVGKDKGKVGLVEKLIFPKQVGCPKNSTWGYKVIIKGIKMVKKHVKANAQLEQKGGIIPQESPVHVSNIAIYNTTTNQSDKVKIQLTKEGSKVRVYKSTGELIHVSI